MRHQFTRVALLGAALGAGLATTAAAQEPVKAAAQQEGARWVVDIVHSQIDFKVRHLIGRVRGTFTNWYAVLTTREGDWFRGTVSAHVRTASLSTGNAYRDADLRSHAFFAVDSFPYMTFDGTGIEAADSTITITGVLTLKGRARPVTLRGQYRGVAIDPEGHERIAFEAGTVLDRRDYGIGPAGLPGSDRLIGNEVEIVIAIEAVKAP